MSDTARLVPLQCPRCQAGVPAQPGEVAWVCASCGQAMLLDESSGITKIDAFFSADIAANNNGRPYWVSLGKVNDFVRQTYRGNDAKAMNEYWAAARLFFIPAWKLGVEEVVNEGIRLLKDPLRMKPGGQTKYIPITVSPRDVRPLAEFIVMSIEAARKDALKELTFKIQLEPAQLWFLP